MERLKLAMAGTWWGLLCEAPRYKLCSGKIWSLEEKPFFLLFSRMTGGPWLPPHYPLVQQIGATRQRKFWSTTLNQKRSKWILRIPKACYINKMCIYRNCWAQGLPVWRGSQLWAGYQNNSKLLEISPGKKHDYTKLQRCYQRWDTGTVGFIKVLDSVWQTALSVF